MLKNTPITENSEKLAEYLQYKIGYIDDNNKAFGMCSSVLTKCQNYTYTDKKYNHNNQVIKEYLQRTLTQIKVAQDEIISGYAENCISDVNSCLSSNNYTSNSNYAINACKAQIVTCMSVNGDATKDPTPAYIKTWVEGMQQATDNNGNNTKKSLEVRLTSYSDTLGTVTCDTTQNTIISIEEGSEIAKKLYGITDNKVVGDSSWAFGYSDDGNSLNECENDWTLNPETVAECVVSMKSNKLIVTPEYCKTGKYLLIYT